ncbi:MULTISPECIES: protein TolQ [Thiomicrorhabdus]|uniref:Tol-Pal system protein TolQ n=1 Tax=Thiomicrorhabdus heinhorstiae TaxID=2748010 RepID=A0ABS0BW33_9GAMM|nr:MULTISPECIES: protein TolQ [Thiomicrorhabdus]MBF6058032.1 protein TolQ [Thiomicrorhabdus heinhorstiae]
MNDNDLIEIVLGASPVVQAVMLILALMSIAAWAVSFAKSYQIRQALKAAKRFDNQFWEATELTTLYHQVEARREDSQGSSIIFAEGFKEFVRLQQQGVVEASDLVAGSQRAMKVAFSKEAEHLENRLSMLATVGSSAPYIGLFGTVWGVMHAFQSLGSIQHATLEAVAPGISEALIATAIGLFAAIPAVIAYNRLTNRVDRLLGEYENFAEGFLTILQRQAHSIEHQSRNKSEQKTSN